MVQNTDLINCMAFLMLVCLSKNFYFLFLTPPPPPPPPKYSVVKAKRNPVYKIDVIISDLEQSIYSKI